MKPYAAALIGDSALSAMVLHSYGPDHLDPFEPFRIEAIAELEDSVVVWDPNDAPVLYVHTVGLSDATAAEVVWGLSELAIAESEWRGPELALKAGSDGCGFGGLTVTINAISPEDNAVVSVQVRMERYICSGSPWTSP